MLFRLCVGTVASLYSRARLPRLLSFLLSHQRGQSNLLLVTIANRVSSGYAFSPVCVNSGNKDQYGRSTILAEPLGVVPFALTHGRKIHTIHEDEKKQTETKENSPVDLILNSVVEVFFEYTEYSKSRPWQTLEEKGRKGSGFAISGKKILTNAHVVDVLNEHALVHVQKHGSQIKYQAKVQKIAHECDLAILEIDSNDFWKGINPLELGDIPPLDEVVTVVGYHGDEIHITKGRVTKIEVKSYLQSDTKLLAIQIDTLIKNGNSGGPVFMGSKVIGVAFQFRVADKISFVIPTPIIKHFITGVEESDQSAVFGSLCLSYQHMENAQIRDHFKMIPQMTGILINEINLSSGAHKILEKDDIILAIDGVSMGNDGTVPFRNKERISFHHLVSMKKPGDTILIKVLRKGKEHEYNISIKPVKPDVKVQQYYNLPSYYIFGGFVFVPLTKTFIDESSHMCECVLNDTYIKAGEQKVIISEILVDDINKEYISFKDLQVEKVNGMKVKNLKHLCKLIEECCTEDVRLDLEDDKVMVFNYESAKKATSRILKSYNIMSVTSKDICLPRQLHDPYKDNRIDLLPWSVLPRLLDQFLGLLNQRFNYLFSYKSLSKVSLQKKNKIENV